MTVENIVSTLVEQLPNLAIALLVLYWQRTTIDKLLDHQRTLIDRLLQMVDVVSEGQTVQVTQGSKSTLPPPVSADSVHRVTSLTGVILLMLFLLR